MDVFLSRFPNLTSLHLGNNQITNTSPGGGGQLMAGVPPLPGPPLAAAAGGLGAAGVIAAAAVAGASAGAGAGGGSEQSASEPSRPLGQAEALAPSLRRLTKLENLTLGSNELGNAGE